MTYWWQDDASEKYWVEIRKAPGTGTELRCPEADRDGGADPWYELVSSVRRGDVIMHWHAGEHRFVGRSVASAPADLDTLAGEPEYVAPLDDFEPIADELGLPGIRAIANDVDDIRDQLEATHGRPLYLPFQFTQDRSRLSFMSNYFAKLPVAMVVKIFGETIAERTQIQPPRGERSARSFLKPFAAKADTKYRAITEAGHQTRSRDHETLVNSCAAWVRRSGFEPGRNAAVDLGLEDPPVIFEAKILGRAWANSIREAVGQLYEYRYFEVADPKSKPIFLVDQRVPDHWIEYLEGDRGIGVAYPAGASFKLSGLAKSALLSK
ncbi:MAG: hypothetical protein M3O28_06880 [Actinomycetota bacterium]|nr:hypothetical protein [Actinomycetota bacterium]